MKHVKKFNQLIILLIPVCMAILAIPLPALSEDSLKEKYNLEFIAVPLITANPNFGNGGGASVMALFDLGTEQENLPPSSLGLTGLYSDRGSHALFLGGSLFPDPNWRIKAGGGNVNVKNELDIDDLPDRADFTTAVNVFLLQGQYRVTDKFYAGMQGKLKDVSYSPDNASGEQYLKGVGAEDETSASLGLVLSYDSRDNRFFPYEGLFSEVLFTPKPESLGSETDYYVLEGSVNGYNQFRQGHVVAWRLFGMHTPDDTPYSDLSTLGQRSDLRGYVSGEHIANNLISAQVEYRWSFRGKWKLVGFVGEAALFDNGDLSSDSLYASAGAGIRYVLSKERRMNLRVDFAVGEESDGVYIGLSEAF